jgi:hypothetical protein
MPGYTPSVGRPFLITPFFARLPRRKDELYDDLHSLPTQKSDYFWKKMLTPTHMTVCMYYNEKTLVDNICYIYLCSNNYALRTNQNDLQFRTDGVLYICF